MLSLAANATISAHETTHLHTASSIAFALSMTSNPLKLGLFGGESFSAVFEVVESISTDASQPYIGRVTYKSLYPRSLKLVYNI